jgi:AraC-like DNA-binding protein
MIRDMQRTVRTLPPALRTRAAEARVHVAALREIPAVLERLGVPWQPLLDAAGLTRDDLDDPDRSAGFAQLDALLGACVRRSRCPHFGLLLGHTVDLHSLGIAGRLARNAPTVGAALQALRSHFVLHDNGGAPAIAIHGGIATLSYGVHAPRVRNLDQVYDLSVAAMCNVMRQLCGPGWRPDLVRLPRRRPEVHQPYREILGAPLRFDSTQAALEFPERWLTRPVLDADPLLHRVLAEHAAGALQREDPLLADEVRRAIRELLLAGGCSREAAARRLGLHPRTLGRRLHAAGTTFQSLLDETRASVARQLLRDTRVTVARVATTLGYRDATVFTRAFHRWTGCNPGEYRGRPARSPARSAAARRAPRS